MSSQVQDRHLVVLLTAEEVLGVVRKMLTRLRPRLKIYVTLE